MTDFFNQFTEFVSWYGQIWGRGIKAPIELFTFMKELYLDLNYMLNGIVHPYFMAIFAFAMGIALVHKFTRWNSKG